MLGGEQVQATSVKSHGASCPQTRSQRFERRGVQDWHSGRRWSSRGSFVVMEGGRYLMWWPYLAEGR